MALTEYYVDPAIAANSGTGTIGDPFGDLQYALDTVTRDATNGDKFNIKEGTDEILAASLDLATYGTPSSGAPIVFRGYTSVADDGGIGGINGNGSVSILNSTTLDFIIFSDLHMHNCGLSDIIAGDDFIYVLNCEIDNTAGRGLFLGNHCRVINNYIHNVGAEAIYIDLASFALNNYVKNGINQCTYGIRLVGTSGIASNNIISINGTSTGITANGDSNQVINNNSVFSVSGTGYGIRVETGRIFVTVINNIVEGFSGVGGIGFSTHPTNTSLLLYANNKAFNNTTNFDISGGVIINKGNNESLTSSPFKNPSNGDFTLSPYITSLLSYPSEFNGSLTPNYGILGAMTPKRITGKDFRFRNRQFT